MAICIKSAQWLVSRLTVFCLLGILPLVWAGQLAPALTAPTPFATPSARDFAFLQPQFERIGDDTSIPDGAITALAQDARGLIWIGTQFGLVSYDGYRFRRFIHAANDPASLADDFVNALWAAKDGRIWVATLSDGLSVFDPATEQFEHRAHDPQQAGSLSAGKISALLGDAQGGIWVATSNGLDYLPSGSKNFIHYRHDPSKPNSLFDNQVSSLLIDRQGRLWVGGAGGLQRLTQDRQGFEAIQGGPNPALATRRHIQSLFEAQDGKIWLGTSQHGAAWIAPAAQTQTQADAHSLPELHWLASDTPLSLSHPWITCIAQVQPDQIWLASNGGGINIVAAADGKVLQHLRHDPGMPNSMALDSTRTMLFDRAGLLWMGNWGGGLQRYNTNNKMLRMLHHIQTMPSGLSHADVRSVLALDDGRILFGSYGNGIDIFDRERGLVGGYRTGPAGALPDGMVRAMIQTPDGALWVGTQKAGAVRMLPGGTSWQAMPGLQGQQVRRLLQSRNGDLWAATDRGVARWNASRAGGPQFEAVPDENGKPMQNLVLALVEDQQGRIWAGSEHGLWVMEPGAKGLHGIHPEAGRKNSLISDFITSLLSDSQNRLWVTTGKGLERLSRWDGKRAEFVHVNALLGQTERATDGNLLEDKAGLIWTEFGVIHPDKMQMTLFDKVDGHNLGTSWLGAYSQTRDGLMLFGGSQGVVILNPALLQAWHYQAPLVVTGLKINGQSTPPGALAQPGRAGASLTLNPGQRNFVLEFAALDYTAPERNRYQYRLQGYEKDWIDTDAAHRSAAYGNLWPGRYTLQVRGSNRNGEWSVHELAIPVRVLPLWYQIWWSWLLGLAVLFGAGYGAYRKRVASLRAQAQAQAVGLQKLIDARTADIVKLSEIGKGLTSTLDTEQAFQRIYQQVSMRMDTRLFLIAINEEAAQQVRFVYLLSNGQRQDIPNRALSRQNCPAAWCVREKRELIAKDNTELTNYLCLDEVPPGYVGMETVVYLPLTIEQHVIGCLSVQSLRYNAYDQSQLEFLRVLASYTAIALSNSTAHGNLAQAHKYLQETQQQMVLQEKMAGLGTLTAGVAHEINNPTNFVHVAAQNQRTDIAEFQQFVAGLIDEDEAGEVMAAFDERFKKLTDNVATMLNGTERIKRIVKDLRSFTRLDEAEKKSVRLSECVNSTLNLVSTVWLEKVEFIPELTDDPEIECWPALLNQALMNLLINGCQAIAQKQAQTQSASRGKLWVRMKLAAENDSIAIIFEDNGVGMDEATQKRILEPFYTTREVGSGTGLGLSIAFGIVQKHGGTLTFVSSVGVGSCFTVSLPRQTTQGVG